MYSSNPQEQTQHSSSAVKTLLYIILSFIIIIGSLITLFITHKNLDKNITKSIISNSQKITISNNLLLEIGSEQRALLALEIKGDYNKKMNNEKMWRTSLSKSENLSNSLQTNFKYKTDLSKINTARKNYINTTENYLKLIRQNKNASTYLINVQNKEFKNYRSLQLKFTENLNKQFLIETHSITEKSSNIVWALFLAGLFAFGLIIFTLLKSTRQ